MSYSLHISLFSVWYVKYLMKLTTLKPLTVVLFVWQTHTSLKSNPAVVETYFHGVEIYVNNSSNPMLTSRLVDECRKFRLWYNQARDCLGCLRFDEVGLTVSKQHLWHSTNTFPSRLPTHSLTSGVGEMCEAFWKFCLFVQLRATLRTKRCSQDLTARVWNFDVRFQVSRQPLFEGCM